MRIRTLLLTIAFMSALGSVRAQSEYVFWFNKGDCSSGNRTGIFIDTTNTVDIEYFDSLRSAPDSIFYTLNNETEMLRFSDHYFLNISEPGTYKLFATIWSKGKSYKIDTSFNAVHIPVIFVQYERGKNKSGEEVLELQLYDSDSLNVTAQYFCCFADIKVMDSNGDFKFFWGGQLSLNLTKFAQNNDQLKKGDIIEFTHLRLLLKSINRSFAISPELQIMY